MAATNGFAGAYARSSHSVSVSALAGSGTGMERDYDYSATVHGADLDDPAEIGRRAGERAVRRLGPRKVATPRVPIVIEQRLAGGDRTSGVWGKRVSVRVDLGGRTVTKKKKNKRK